MTTTRRDFLGAAVAGALIAGCRRVRYVAPPAGSAVLGEVEKELSIYNWSDYIAPNTVPDFEKEYGVKVNYDTFESSEEMVAKLQAGASGYDLVVGTPYGLATLIRSGILAPLSQMYLPNLGNIAPIFNGLKHDPKNEYTVPWLWGTTGITWRADLLPGVPPSWGVFLDRRYKGKMTMLDDPRDVIGAFLRYRGHSINSDRFVEVEQAKRDAIAAKLNLRAFISAPVKSQLISGDVPLAQLWSGDAVQAIAEQSAIRYVTPQEGSTMLVDFMAVPKAAPHPRAAHEFINYILRRQVAATIADATGYGTPNQGALEFLKTPKPFPTPDELARLEIQMDLGRASEMWDRVWTEIKAA